MGRQVCSPTKRTLGPYDEKGLVYFSPKFRSSLFWIRGLPLSLFSQAHYSLTSEGGRRKLAETSINNDEERAKQKAKETEEESETYSSKSDEE